MSLNQRGNMLVSTLISVVITGIMASVMSSIIVNANRESQGLTQKFEILDTRQAVLGTLADSAICGCNFDLTKNAAAASGLRFNSTNLTNATITVPTLFKSCNAAGTAPANNMITAGQALPGTSSGLTVGSIQIQNIVSTGTPGAFRGDLNVTFDSSRTVTARKPATVSVNFQADVSNPSQARITGCQAAGVGAAAGGPMPTACQQSNFQGSVYYRRGTFSGPVSASSGCFSNVSGGMSIDTPIFLECNCPTGKRKLSCLGGATDSGTNSCRTTMRGPASGPGGAGGPSGYVEPVFGGAISVLCCD